jgi:hypothetical protein
LACVFERHKLTQIKSILLKRLKSKGLDPSLIPGLIKDISNTMLNIRYVTLEQVNERLRFLGWDNIELDEHTFQLVIAHLEQRGWSTGSRCEDPPLE